MNPQHETSGEPEMERSQRRITTPVRHVVVPLDLSATAAQCLTTVIAVARAVDARVTLLHVLESQIDASGEHPTDALAWEIQRREARNHLENALAQLARSGVEAKIKIVQGHAAEQIIAETSAPGIDLTVLSRHGKSGNNEWTIGSTAQKVLERARGSLLVVPAIDSVKARWRLPPRRVLVPLDGSIRAECALAVARPVAEASDAELILLNIVGVPHGPPDRLLGESDSKLACELAERWERSTRKYLGRILGEITTTHRAVRNVVEPWPDVPQALLEIVERERVDLVVLTAHGTTCNTRRSYGSVADHIINYCKCPVLLVQDLVSEHRLEHAGTHFVTPLAEGRLP